MAFDERRGEGRLKYGWMDGWMGGEGRKEGYLTEDGGRKEERK